MSALGDLPTSSHADRPALLSVSIALSVLDALSVAPALSVSELARRVGIAKSSAHRTCGVLTSAGILDRTENGWFRLGVRLSEFGQLALARTPVGRRALPVLIELRSELGLTVQLGVPFGNCVIYIAGRHGGVGIAGRHVPGPRPG